MKHAPLFSALWCKVYGPLFLIFLGVCFTSQLVSATVETQPRSFSIPRGEALVTLQALARQASVDIFYSAEGVEGVMTPSLIGVYTPQEAFDIVLAGTSLAAFQHEESGAFVIRRVTDTAKTTEPKTNQTDDMTNRSFMKTFRQALISMGLALSASGAIAQDDTDEDVLILSPFVIQGDEEVGYQATQTLGGTRLRADLRDIGSAISVVTETFLEDTGSNELQDFLVYTTSTEVGGIGGNFAGGGGDFNNVIRNPQNSTRLRGLGSADLTRNYYLTNIPMDTYNTTRVDIQRGPNAILFGLGSPAGIINNTLVRAEFTTYTELAFMADSFGGYRGSFRINREVLDDRLAVFIAGLNEEKKFEQDAAFDDDRRIYTAINLKITDSTTLTANLEVGDIIANRPRPGPPLDYITPWYTYGRPVWDTFDTNRLPPPVGRNNGLHGTTADFLFGPGEYYFDPTSSTPDPLGGEGLVNGRVTQGAGPLLSGSFLPIELLAQRYGRNGPLIEGVPAFGPDAAFWITPSILDDRIFDFREILAEGPNSGQRAEFEAYNFTLEQQLLDGDAGIELAFDKQTYTTENFSGISGARNFGLYLDFNRQLLDGRPNPNFGGIASYSTNLGNDTYNEREAIRATAYYDLDFVEKMGDSTLTNILGKTIFTALYNTQTVDSGFNNYRDTPDPIVGDIQPNMFTNGNLWNASNYRAYPVSGLPEGQTLVDLASAADLVNIDIGGITARQPKRDVGTFSMWSQANQQFETFEIPIYHQFNRPELAALSGDRNRNVIDSYAVIAQSYLFWENLVTTIGWRRDEVEQFNAGSAPNNPDFANRRVNIADPNWRLPDEPGLDLAEEVWSYSGVFHMPDFIMENLPWNSELSFHYSESSNFIPQGRRIDLENNTISPPTGETTEYGFTVSLFDRKLYLRVNWYETSQLNVGGYGPNVASVTTRILRQGLESFADNDPVNAGFQISDIPIPTGPILDIRGFEFDFENLTAFESPDTALSGTSDLVSEGTEIELNYNPIPNWTMVLNVSQTKASRDNTSPSFARFIDEFMIPEFVNSSFGDFVITAIPNRPTVRELAQAEINNFRLRQFQDGGPVGELKEWQWSFITNYEFIEGDLEGFGVGGAMRWQDESSIGFRVIEDPELGFIQDVTDPFFGPTDFKVDAWVSYKKKILDDKVDWRIQLNVRNLLNDDDLIPIAVQPTGETARVLIPEPLKFELSTKFSF